MPVSFSAPVPTFKGLADALAKSGSAYNEAYRDTFLGLAKADKLIAERDKARAQARIETERWKAAQKMAEDALKAVGDPSLAGFLARKTLLAGGRNNPAWAFREEWKRRAAGLWGKDPNAAVFTANLAGVRVDPHYDVKDHTLFGRYQPVQRITPYGKRSLSIAEALAESRRKALEEQARKFRAQAEKARAPSAPKLINPPSPVVDYVQKADDQIETLFNQQAGFGPTDEITGWVKTRALGLYQQGVPIDRALSIAVREAASGAQKVERSFWPDTVQFTPPSAPDEVRVTPDGRRFERYGNRWFEAQP